jgi:hypothetical protein
MKNLKLIALLLLVSLLVTVNVIGQTKKGKRKTHKQTIGKGYVPKEWPPEKDSLFYKRTVALPRVDRVELYKLDKLNLKDEEGGIKAPRAGKAHVAASKILTEQDAENFTVTWRALKRGTGAGCFAPGYYIKFYSGDHLILETSVCFHCSNLTLTGENGGNEIWAFGAKGKGGKALLDKLKEILSEEK